MANIKIIDLPTGSPESTSFVEATQVDELAESGRSTVKLALNALGNFVAGQGASPLEYGDLETESATLIGGINELHDSIGADAYDDTATYSEGELCIYNNTLYVCTVSGGITTPEAWTPAHWTATTIETLIAAKADSSDVYTKAQVDSALSGKQNTLKFVTIQASLKTSVNISAGSNADIFTSDNLKTSNTLDIFEQGSKSDIPDNVLFMEFLWANGSNTTVVYKDVTSGLCSLRLWNMTGSAVTCSKVRLFFIGY